MTAISCPVCAAPFCEMVRDGILIDVCTRCQGVWLDRGELERLLSAVYAAGGGSTGEVRPYRPPPLAAQHGRPAYAHGYGHDPRHRKKPMLETSLNAFD